MLKHGRVLMLADDAGDVPWRRPHGYGRFVGDTRVLDGFVLELAGRRPIALSASDTRGFEVRHDLTNPELQRRDAGRLPCNGIAVRRERLIRGDVLQELLSVCKHEALDHEDVVESPGRRVTAATTSHADVRAGRLTVTPTESAPPPGLSVVAAA